MNNSRKTYLKINGKNICGKIIEDYRKKFNISRQELSDKLLLKYELDLSAQSIYDIENLERTVTDYELLAISDILNFNITIISDIFKNNFK